MLFFIKIFKKYIHEEDMVHGNLKPENFLFENENEDSIVKITDVALFTILDKDLLKHSIESSSQYCAPEVLRGEVGHAASDMWSLGAFTYTLYFSFFFLFQNFKIILSLKYNKKLMWRRTI
jgi:serine/threonine protein kinase